MHSFAWLYARRKHSNNLICVKLTKVHVTLGAVQRLRLIRGEISVNSVGAARMNLAVIINIRHILISAAVVLQAVRSSSSGKENLVW